MHNGHPEIDVERSLVSYRYITIWVMSFYFKLPCLFHLKHYRVLQALEFKEYLRLHTFLHGLATVTSPTKPSRRKTTVGYLQETVHCWFSRNAPLTIVTTTSLQATTQTSNAIIKDEGLFAATAYPDTVWRWAQMNVGTALKKFGKVHP